MARKYSILCVLLMLFGCCSLPIDNTSSATPGLITFAWFSGSSLWRGLPQKETLDMSCDELVLIVAALQLAQWQINEDVTTDLTLSAAFSGVEMKFRQLLGVCERQKEKDGNS